MASLKLNINTVSSNAVITSDTVDIVNWKAGQITGTSADVVSSTATGDGVGAQLIDDSVNFNSPTAQVLVGDKVINTSASTNATVTGIVNDTTLTLTVDIMEAGAEYTIGVPSSSGQVYSATPTDFGVNSYFTPDMAGSIIVNTSDNTKTTILEVINSNRIKTADTGDYGLAKAFTIHTPSSNYPGYALYVSTSASISTLPATYVSFKVLTVDGDTTTFTNFPIGTVLPVQVKRVFTTGLVGSPVFVAIV